MKSLQNIQHLKKLSKENQKAINGGKIQCDYNTDCPSGQCCSSGSCWPIGTPGRLCMPPSNNI